MKPGNSVRATTLILSIMMGLQFVIVGLYIGLLVWPFYYNDLHMLPGIQAASGSFDPKTLAPFCHTPPDAPSWWYSRCADGAEGNPWGDELHDVAILTALLGPVLLGILGGLVGVILIRTWSTLRFSTRVIGLIQFMVSLGALGFMWGTPLGQLLFVWIRD